MIAEPIPDTWFSTYGLLTAERILARFNIHLKPNELSRATHNPDNFYFQLLRIPFKNIMNGIIFAQAQDYRVYAQKMFVDFLICGQSADPESAVNIREDLERERTQLVALGDGFDQTEYDHQSLIIESQKALIGLAKSLPSSPQATHYADLENLISPYIEKTKNMHDTLCDYRNQFYEIIINSNQLLQYIPDYRPDILKQQKNREELNFNAKIGEKK